MSKEEISIPDAIRRNECVTKDDVVNKITKKIKTRRCQNSTVISNFEKKIVQKVFTMFKKYVFLYVPP